MGFERSKLDELRKKYGEGHGGELFDPRFRKVADKIFSKSGTRLAPYAGVPTFLTAPYLAVDAENPDFGDLDVAVVGVPMDLGVTNRNGARFGPRALRTIERIGPYNHVLETAPVHELRVADIGDVPFQSRYRLELSHQDIEKRIGQIVAAIHEAFSLAVANAMWLAFAGAVGAALVVTLLIPEVPLRRTSGADASQAEGRPSIIPAME